MPSLLDLLADMESGKTSATALCAAALERAADLTGEGGRVFTRIFAESARAEAAAADGLRRAGVAPLPLAGLVISIKDLLDVKGLVTQSGSRALADQPPAQADAVVLQRLRAAGAVIIGRTNMSELAFTGVGMNPHFGTPRNPWDRATGRIPGGSSSGAAISITDGMAAAAIGSDTGGSIRIPAALCGLVGFKPTQRRVPLQGARPLSTTLDSLGPLAPTVACCARLDAVLAGQPQGLEPKPATVRGLRLAVPKHVVFDDIETPVAQAWQAALVRLQAAGAQVIDIPFEPLADLLQLTAKVGFSAVECYALHRQAIVTHGELIDPRVYARLKSGTTALAADYVDLVTGRARLIAAAEALLAPYDAWIMPTVPILAPTLAALADDEAFRRANGLLLRNTMLVNLLDGCAISLPCHAPGQGPVGFSIVGPAMADARILSISLALEPIVRGGAHA